MTTIRITTKYTSVDELVARFARFVERDSIFIATTAPLPAGEHRRFLILLADGTVVLDGVGEVMAGDAVVDNRQGARLRFVELEPATRWMHARMLAAKERPHRVSSPPAMIALPLAAPPLPPPVRAPPPPTRARPSGPTQPPPFRKPSVLVGAVVHAPVAAAVPVAEPIVVVAPIAAPPLPDDGVPRVQPRAHRARKRRVAWAAGAIAMSALVGVVFAIGTGGDAAPRVAATTAAIEPPPAIAEVEPEPEPTPVIAPPVVEAPSAAPEPRKAAPVRPRAKGKAPKKRPAAPRTARLTLKSSPPGATFRVNGKTVTASNQTMVSTPATVTITAVIRGYKRTTRSVQIRKDTSLVIPLERMSFR
jgi:hypothetical protein